MSSLFTAALAGSRIYPITDKKISRLSHPEQVARLGSRGARLIQLREKLESAKDFFGEAQVALKIAHARGIKIIINDRVDIALALGADGVHLGQDDLQPTAARMLLGPEAIIGISTHSLAQARLALDLPVDYIAIGPIFPTLTKESQNPPVGLDGLTAVSKLADTMPVVAIGGITLENADSVLRNGALACALIRDIWLDPHENAQKWVDLWHSTSTNHLA